MDAENQTIYCTCGFCREQHKNANIEINFFDQSVYFYCQKCKKMNTITMKPIEAKPYPRARTMR